MAFEITREMLDEFLKNKPRIPILIINKVWLSLFNKERRNKKVNELEKQIILKMKEEGNLNQSIKEMREKKKVFLSEILYYASKIEENGHDNSIHEKMQDINKNVATLNEKIEACEDRLKDIPYEIKELNTQLLEESLNICYNILRKSEEKIDEVDLEIEKIREVLKEKVALRADYQEEKDRSYGLLNSLAGPELVDFLDKEMEK